MRTRILRRAVLALALAGIVAAGLATDTLGRVQRMRPVLIKLEGYVEHAPAATPLVDTLTLGHGKRTRPFALKNLSVPTQPPSPGAVLAAVRPYPTNFMLRGSDATLAPFDHAAAGAGLVIRGQWRPGPVRPPGGPPRPPPPGESKEGWPRRGRRGPAADPP